MAIKNLIGQKFDRLTVIGDAPPYRNRARNYRRLRVKCICGIVKIVRQAYLKNGRTKSCGCLHREILSKRNVTNATHGMSNCQEYNSWHGMKSRCDNEDNKDYEYYGGRGIKVCKRWLKFKNFIADMGKKPSAKHSIDRIDNNGNYEPSNCKWSTAKEQANNQRKKNLKRK